MLYSRSFLNSRVAHSGAAYHHKVVTPTGNVYFAYGACQPEASQTASSSIRHTCLPLNSIVAAMSTGSQDPPLLSFLHEAALSQISMQQDGHATRTGSARQGYSATSP